MENERTAMLEEQRSGLLDQFNYELNLQESKAASAVQNLEQPLLQQEMKLSSRSQDSSRYGQLHLFAQVRDREYALQETLFRMPEDVEELRTLTCLKKIARRNVWTTMAASTWR